MGWFSRDPDWCETEIRREVARNHDTSECGGIWRLHDDPDEADACSDRVRVIKDLPWWGR